MSSSEKGERHDFPCHGQSCTAVTTLDKEQSMERYRTTSPRKKKFKTISSNRKVMIMEIWL